MSLLFRVVSGSKCRGTHHKLAVDALTLLHGEQADRWRDLLLTRSDEYLRGATAPDDEFRDFRNHVLHVADGGWGGAVTAAEQWYQEFVAALQKRKWSQAAYAAGVLTHYLTDPVMPLHTAQSEAQNNLQRACEWSVARSYNRLTTLLREQLGGYPAVELPAQEQWLKRLMTRNAATAHAEFDLIVGEFDFATAVKKPTAGLNEALQHSLARLLGLATVTCARVLERAIAESAAKPPRLFLMKFKGVRAALQTPFAWLARRSIESAERRLVKSIHRELQQTGRVEQCLPEEQRAVRDLYAREVLATAPVAPPLSESVATGAASAAGDAPRQILPVTTPVAAPVKTPVRKPKLQGKLPRFGLEPDDPIADAPSIGVKTAKRLQQVGISCVELFLEHTPADIVSLVEVTTISLEEVRTWQQQARLMCQVPGLQTADVQMLIACGVTDPDLLAEADASRLHQQLARFVTSPTAKRLMKNPQAPDKSTVQNWIAWAAYARPLRAA